MSFIKEVPVMQYEFSWLKFLKFFFINVWKLIPLFFVSWIAVLCFLSVFGAKGNGFVLISSAVVVVVVGLILLVSGHVKDDKDWYSLLWGLMVGLVGMAAIVCFPISYLLGTWNKVTYEENHKICIEAGCNRERTGREYYCSAHLYNHTSSKSSSSYSSKKNTKKTTKSTYTYNTSYSYDFDPDDYDSPEDFADDAWGDFGDWDDAYDYWDNY